MTTIPEQKALDAPHKITLDARSRLSITGVLEIESFDEGMIALATTRGPLVMEVNASPGLEGVEKTTGVDIAGKMILWIERHATPGYCLKTGG